MRNFKTALINNVKYIGIVLFFVLCGIFGGNALFTDNLSNSIDTASAIILLRENSYIILSIIFMMLIITLGTSFCGVVLINIICIIKGFYTAVYANMFLCVCDAGIISFFYMFLSVLEIVFFAATSGVMLCASLYFFVNFKQPFSVTEKFLLLLRKDKLLLIFAGLYIFAAITGSVVSGSI